MSPQSYNIDTTGQRQSGSSSGSYAQAGSFNYAGNFNFNNIILQKASKTQQNPQKYLHNFIKHRDKGSINRHFFKGCMLVQKIFLFYQITYSQK